MNIQFGSHCSNCHVRGALTFSRFIQISKLGSIDHNCCMTCSMLDIVSVENGTTCSMWHKRIASALQTLTGGFHLGMKLLTLRASTLKVSRTVQEAPPTALPDDLRKATVELALCPSAHRWSQACLGWHPSLQSSRSCYKDGSCHSRSRGWA